MPEGPAAQQSFIPEPQQESPDETANLLAADKAMSRGQLQIANDNFQPYDEEPGDANDIPQKEGEEMAPDYQAENEAEDNTKAEQQAQLDVQQQADVAAALAGNKQRQLLQIAKKRYAVEKQLSELEKNLTDFKDSKLSSLLKIFKPKILLLIDTLVEGMKKNESKLSNEAKVSYYTGLIITASSLINLLRALKFFTAILDAAFTHKLSCLRLIIMTATFIIPPIIIAVLSPIFIPFFALIFIIGVIPLLKGLLTNEVIDMIKKLKKQRTAWRAELAKAKKKVALRKQIKDLNRFEKEVKKWK